MSQKWIVVGGGFRGIVGAYLLSKRGADVTVIEKSGELGSVLRSVPWKGFFLDKGCHIFSNESDETTEMILDILGDAYETVDVRYASITNGQKIDGIAIPHLGCFGKDVPKEILYELVCLACKDASSCSSLEELFRTRYGPTAAQYLSQAVQKQYQIHAADVDPETLEGTLYPRIKFMEDAPAAILKQIPFFDDRVAVSSVSDPLRFYRQRATKYPFRNYYPTEKGMYMFCECAEVYLRQAGVSLQCQATVRSLSATADSVALTLSSGEELFADRLLWASDLDDLTPLLGIPDVLGEYVHPVPMIVYFFVIERGEAGPYTYVHHFDDNTPWFRASVPGNYVSQPGCVEGLSYVCCEVPTLVDSPLWKDADGYISDLWKDLQKYEIVRSEQPRDTLNVRLPVSYSIPKVGYSEALTRIREQQERFPALVVPDPRAFAKNEIVAVLKEALFDV